MASTHTSEDMGWDLPEQYHMLSHVHGALCALAVVGIFPVGAILLRISRWYPVSLHMWTQLLGFFVYFAGFAASIVLWTHLEDGFEWTAGPHGQLGVAVSVCVLLQTVLGLWNHQLYRMRYDSFMQGQVVASPRRSILAWMHILLGWFIVVGGIVNGALGISQKTTGFYRHKVEQRGSQIAYSILGAVAGTIFCTVLGWRWLHYTSRWRRRVVIQPSMSPEEEAEDRVMELREARGTTVAHL